GRFQMAKGRCHQRLPHRHRLPHFSWNEIYALYPITHLRTSHQKRLPPASLSISLSYARVASSPPPILLEKKHQESSTPTAFSQISPFLPYCITTIPEETDRL
ncbi:hypothetical protein AMTR_s00584p00009520, partial [Amborella trichopoda]